MYLDLIHIEFENVRRCSRTWLHDVIEQKRNTVTEISSHCYNIMIQNRRFGHTAPPTLPAYKKNQFSIMKKDLMTHVAKFYGRLRLIRSVLRASNFPCLKFLEIVILWVYYTIPFGFTLFGHFWAYIFNFLKYFLWLRITDEG